MTYAPDSRASCVTIVPTAPAAPCARTLCPARRRPWSNSPCHAVRPEIGRLAPTVNSTSPGSGARLRASIATYSARVPSRCQSARPNTRCPTDTPVVPYPRALTTPASSCPRIDGARSRPARSVQVEGHAVSVGTNPDAWTSTMTSFIAAGGSGRSISVMPAVPAASSVTTIAFIRDLLSVALRRLVGFRVVQLGPARDELEVHARRAERVDDLGVEPVVGDDQIQLRRAPDRHQRGALELRRVHQADHALRGVGGRVQRVGEPRARRGEAVVERDAGGRDERRGEVETGQEVDRPAAGEHAHVLV